MTTLIAVYDSSGCWGRCDARCYDATSELCDCICGGMNHGAGIRQATDNTRAMAEQWVMEYTGRLGLESWRSEIPALNPVQLPLFEV
ncbi:MAG: hypothetical protein Kow0031_38000 [Anaerolineae bacterium]